ncbi:MAG TPA: glycoside hydrolase family 15 protein [Stellaceae bacterium]|nr:glycoside hydrolase family 15 protein [Stellaceae bacterium]
MSRPLEDYALIGDCQTAALVARDGSIDWLCWPSFDSGACFAALLGSPENGRWLLAPQGPARTSRRYRPDTLILETEFETAEGAVAVIDFMPPRGHASDVVRIVEGRRGRVEMCTELVLRFDYGSIVPWVRRLEDGTLKAIAGPDMTVLRTPVPLRGEGLKTVASFAVSAGERVPFVLTYGPSHLRPPREVDAESAFADTERFWRRWTGRCKDAGLSTPIVRRSLITLKALTDTPTGAIVAAPTTSLPEALGGPRNWDYRFCWLRDATFTLLALMNGGYYDEAARWRDWLLRALAGSASQMQIMYGIRGERRLPEFELPWLQGYEGSRPVRVGNAAHEQLQLDVYGEVMDALHIARASERLPPDEVGWALQRALLDHLETIWRAPDEGIWEVRNGRRQFTYSKVMAWVAFDRAVQAVEASGLDGPAERWRRVRDEIHDEVLRSGFNPTLGSFAQYYGSDHLDASLLLIPLVGFLPPEDPRVAGTVAAIEQHLMYEGMVMRYDTERNPDGLPAGEGVFIACSLWLADNYILLGRRAEGRAMFDRIAGLANDVGLLSEEYDLQRRRLLGNFPQAFSHIALVNTAHNLGVHDKPAEQRAGARVTA